VLIDHKSIITNDPKKTLNPSLKIFLNSSGRKNLLILTARSAVIVPIISHVSSIYFLCAELTPQAYKLCAVTRKHLHLQGVPSPQTVHRTVWGFTLCKRLRIISPSLKLKTAARGAASGLWQGITSLASLLTLMLCSRRLLCFRSS